MVQQQQHATLGVRRMLLPPTLGSPPMLGTDLRSIAVSAVQTVTENTFGSMHSDSETCPQLSGLQPRLSLAFPAAGETPNSRISFSRHPLVMSEALVMSDLQHSKWHPEVRSHNMVLQQMQEGRLSLLSSPTVRVAFWKTKALFNLLSDLTTSVSWWNGKLSRSSGP